MKPKQARGYLELVAADFDPDVGAAVEQALGA